MHPSRSLMKRSPLLICHSCRVRLGLQTLLRRRNLHNSKARLAITPPEDDESPPPASYSSGMEEFEQALRKASSNTARSGVSRGSKSQPKPGSGANDLSPILSDLSRAAAFQASSSASSSFSSGDIENEPYHINVYSHRHNTHITFTKPSRDPILSFSAGNLGLRKAQRSTYDAAYQLSAYTLRKMMEKQWRRGGGSSTKGSRSSSGPTQTMGNVQRIEVVFRGFGIGREAFQKALLGPEGRLVKPKVVKVTDATRLKFGGVRSPQVRRLG